MVLKETILTKNPCYKSGKKITPRGIMLNSVGCPQPSAKVFVHNLNRESGSDRCPHAFVDATHGEVYQTLPWNHRGCYSGKHPTTRMNCNQTHIGVTLCEPSQIRYLAPREIELKGDKDAAIAAAKRVYEATVELCAKLCRDFNLCPSVDIISHKEGFEKGIANERSDPSMVWELLGLDYTMDKLRNDVTRAMGITPAKAVTKTNVPPNAKPVAVKAPEPTGSPITLNEEESKERLIKISVDNLRIRSGPGTENPPIGKYTGKGTFAITEIQNGTGSKAGWGKLRNGAGWVSLDYVEML